MNLKRRKDDYQKILKKYFFHQNDMSSLQPLTEFLQSIKKENFQEVLDFLKGSPKITEHFSNYLHQLFQEKPFNLSLTEAGILSESEFFPEFRKRLLNKFLPPVENEDTVWYLIEKTTTSPKNELKYLQHIPSESFSELMHVLNFQQFIKSEFVRNQILFSINVLCWRLMGSVMNTGILNMVPEYRNFKSPFISLKNEIDELSADFTKDSQMWLTSEEEKYKQIKIYLSQCFDFVDTAFKNSSKYGITAKINQELLKINQQLNRIKEISWLLVIDQPSDYEEKSKLLIFDILRYKSHRNNLKELVDDNTRLISHLITNHTAETGIQYITSTYRGYVKMFWKSLGGGVIIGILCVLLLLFSQIPTSEFLHAVYYSLTLGLGFVLIYLMRFLLATTQPAMTAATIAQVLSEDVKTEKNYSEFAHLMARLMRSQFISFLGNVIIAFPAALLLIYGLDVLFNLNFATHSSDRFLENLNPFQSKLIWHSIITGVFIFVSGIMVGTAGNNSVYYKIPRRIEESSRLNRLFGKKFAESIGNYYANNWAGIVGNFWFGVLLGIIGPIGKFLGLDLGFRHMIISAGNLALGLYGKDFNVSISVVLISIFSILIIGFFNFWVSFSLSILLAFRSRSVKFEDSLQFVKATLTYLVKNPFRFFFPVQSYLDSKAQEMIEKAKKTTKSPNP